MGLSLTVGILAELRGADVEGERLCREQFARLGEHLRARGLSVHVEPDACESWSCDMLGYGALHHLRRVAAHLARRRALPEAGDDDAHQDPVVQEYYDAALAPPGRATFASFWRRLFGRAPKRSAGAFDHLLLHGDAEGFYLPLDFAEVLFPPASLHVPGGMVGSSVCLLRECEALADVLAVPDGMGPDSDELHKAIEEPETGDEPWQSHAVATHACLALREGCHRSLATGAALVFT